MPHPKTLPRDCLIAWPEEGEPFLYDDFNYAVANSCGLVLKSKEMTRSGARKLFHIRHCNNCPHMSAAELYAHNPHLRDKDFPPTSEEQTQKKQ